MGQLPEGVVRSCWVASIDLSMSAAVQPVATLPTLPSGGPPAHNPLHHPPGGLPLPPLGSAPVMMPRPPTTLPSLGPSLPPSHQDTADLAEAAPNQDVLLALLARNKNLEGRDSIVFARSRDVVTGHAISFFDPKTSFRDAKRDRCAEELWDED